jgi:RimJ/RimL family protein N-acetyltransferase
VTAELELVPLSVALMQALVDGRRQNAERALDARIPLEWDLPAWVLRMRIAQLEADPSAAPWLLRAIVRRDDRQLVGNVGFHAPPGQHPFESRWPGAVELGYDVVEAFRGRGYASRACAAAIAWASGHGARHVVLSIAPANAASLRVADRLGFELSNEYAHETRGLERLYVRRL